MLGFLLVLLPLSLAQGQPPGPSPTTQFVLKTLVGPPEITPPIWNVSGSTKASDVQFVNPLGLFYGTDEAGEFLLVADSGNHVIRRVSLGDNPTVTVVAGSLEPSAGGGVRGYNGDNILAVEALLDNPTAVTADPLMQSVYIADQGNNRVRQIDLRSGIITTVAGSGVAGYAGEGSVAASAAVQLNAPSALVNNGTHLFIADTNNNVIRVVRLADGVIARFAGVYYTGPRCYHYGYGGSALNASLCGPMGLAYDSNLLYIADTSNNAVRMVDTNGVMWTLAEPAFGSALNYPTALTVFQGRIYFCDTTSAQVKSMATGRPGRQREIDVVAGSTLRGYTGDGAASYLAQLNFPQGVAVQAVPDSVIPNVYFSDSGNGFVRLVSNEGLLATIAGFRQGIGPGSTADPFWSGSPALVQLAYPDSVYLTPDGKSLLIADTSNNVIRKLDLATNELAHFAGVGTLGFFNGTAVSAEFAFPEDIHIGSGGDIYVADTGNHCIRWLGNSETYDPNLEFLVFAGTCTTPGLGAENVPATVSALNQPEAITTDVMGNVYVVDTGNHRIRLVNLVTGLINTVVGNGKANFSGDGGPAILASLNNPSDCQIDNERQYLYIADTANCVVRLVNLHSGVITTLVGYADDRNDSPSQPCGANAVLNQPVSVGLDALGALYIADSGNNRIQRFWNGQLSIIAGPDRTGVPGGYSGDDALALQPLQPGQTAWLYLPGGMFVASPSLIYIADTYNNRIRVWTPGSGSGDDDDDTPASTGLSARTVELVGIATGGGLAMVFVVGCIIRRQSKFRDGRYKRMADQQMGLLPGNAGGAVAQQLKAEDVQLLQEVGSGVSSKVYRARWHGTVVAVKQLLLPTTAKARTNLMATFQHEVRLSTLLANHPRVVPFIGYFISAPTSSSSSSPSATQTRGRPLPPGAALPASSTAPLTSPPTPASPAVYNTAPAYVPASTASTSSASMGAYQPPTYVSPLLFSPASPLTSVKLDMLQQSNTDGDVVAAAKAGYYAVPRASVSETAASHRATESGFRPFKSKYLPMSRKGVPQPSISAYEPPEHDPDNDHDDHPHAHGNAHGNAHPHGNGNAARRAAAHAGSFSSSNSNSTVAAEPTPPLCSIVLAFLPYGSMEQLLIHRKELALDYSKPHEALATLTVLVQMLVDCSAAVLHLHSKGVAHRDIAARNFLVDKTHNVFICDFGMSKILQNVDDVGDVEPDELLPLCYVAPEVVTKSSYSLKSDVFSFGILLYEVVAREAPYQGVDPPLIASYYRNTNPLFRPVIPEHCPRVFADLMRACWQELPAERPPMTYVNQMLLQFHDACNAATALADVYVPFKHTSNFSHVQEVHGAHSRSTNQVPLHDFLAGFKDIG